MFQTTFARKCLVAAATCTLALGTSAILVHAEDMKDMKMDKNDDWKAKAEEQQKAVDSLQTNFDDATFVTVVSMANNDEIKAGEAALKMSSNDDVKKFAQTMVDDHTKVGDTLKGIAEKDGFHVSEECDAKHMMMMHEMKSMTGADFDKAYATAQVKDHEEAVTLLKLAEDKASNADLKAFAKDELPTFEHHLKMAQSLESKMTAMGS